MKACTRCGDWHIHAEKDIGRYLSCTEVKHYWSEMKRRHMDETGHLAMIKIKEGKIVCIHCGAILNETT
jgi:hypothetical protein